MPLTKPLEIDTSKPVLVTGATGYIAGVLIEQLLQAGLTVHATVRDASNTDRLQYLIDLAKEAKKNRPYNKAELHFFEADLLEPGTFTKAMEGCQIVFHTASPYFFTVPDPQKDLVDPAVNGTINVLESVSQCPSVKRVVLTSSTAAIYNSASDTFKVPNNVLTEDVWNRSASLTNNPYYLAKTLAEQKAWEMAGSQTQYKLVAVNPGQVFGPGVKYHSTAESYQFLRKFASGVFVFGAPEYGLPAVHVRDVADGHMAAAFLPDAAGRYILVGKNTNSAEIAHYLQPHFRKYPFPRIPFVLPRLVFAMVVPIFDRDITPTMVLENVNWKINFDNSKSIKELGIDYRPILDKECLVDMFQQIVDADDVKVNRLYLL